MLNALPRASHDAARHQRADAAERLKFTVAYNHGMKKGEYWEYALKDAPDLVAKIWGRRAHLPPYIQGGQVPAYDRTWTGRRITHTCWE